MSRTRRIYNLNKSHPNYHPYKRVPMPRYRLERSNSCPWCYYERGFGKMAREREIAYKRLAEIEYKETDYYESHGRFVLENDLSVTDRTPDFMQVLCPEFNSDQDCRRHLLIIDR